MNAWQLGLFTAGINPVSWQCSSLLGTRFNRIENLLVPVQLSELPHNASSEFTPQAKSCSFRLPEQGPDKIPMILFLQQDRLPPPMLYKGGTRTHTRHTHTHTHSTGKCCNYWQQGDPYSPGSPGHSAACRSSVIAQNPGEHGTGSVSDLRFPCSAAGTCCP
jgi:hypothetical protein